MSKRPRTRPAPALSPAGAGRVRGQLHGEDGRVIRRVLGERSEDTLSDRAGIDVPDFGDLVEIGIHADYDM